MPTKLPRRLWSEMTAADFRAGNPQDWIVVIPVAAIEQHGPHLPLTTDATIGAALLDRAVAMMPAALRVTCLPLLTVGTSDEHSAAAGTLSLRPDTLQAVLDDLAESVIRAGVRRLVFVSSHGGNNPVLTLVAQALRVRHRVLAVSTSFARFGAPDGLFPPDELAFGIHGGAVETALMLNFRPDLVAMDKAAYFGSLQQELADRYRHLRAYGPVQFGWLAQDLNPAGVVGDARLATAAKGRAVAEHQASGFAELCDEIANFDLAFLADYPPAG